jgi:glycine/D-amino acid oxidase-like deaminating enzyme
MAKKVYADVLVIGGGVIGASSCYYLSKKNLKVALVEKSGIATGASGSCDGFIFLQSKKDNDLISLTRESLKIFENLSEELSYDIEFEKCGGLVIRSGSETSGDFLDFGQFQEMGIKVELLDNKQLREIEPFISGKAAAGAAFCKDEGQVNPINLTIGFALAARKNGAELLTGKEVREIEVSSEGGLKKIKRVLLGDGTEIVAKEVLCCCGAWSGMLGTLLGIEIPIMPRRGNLIVTETLPEILHHVILDYDYICCKFDESKELGFTIEQAKSGNLIIGSTREFAGFYDGYDFSKIKSILKRAAYFFPLIKDVSVIRIFSGFRPFSKDFKPLIGSIPGFSNFSIAAGHEGDGIALSPVTGKIISKLIADKLKEEPQNTGMFKGINIEKFSPGRVMLCGK